MTTASRLVLQGQACSRGMALGRARLIHPAHFDVDDGDIPAGQVPVEIARFEQALTDARDEMAAIRRRLSGSLVKELGEMLDAHALLLDDPVFTDAVRGRIRDERVGTHAALRRERDRLMAEFAAIDDPYLRSRSEDIEYTIGRVVAALYRDGSETLDPATLAGEIVVSDQVAPADLAEWHEHGVLGVVSTSGSMLSHSAILARSLRLPLLCGVEDALSRIHEGDVLLADGESGRVLVHPDEDDRQAYLAWRDESARDEKRLGRLRKAPTRTADGVDIRLWANAEQLADVTRAYALGAAGVGLYRTEFLFLQRATLPDEDEQYQAYANVVRAMKGRVVTIRTLDVGADKADRSGLALSHEPNPALGVRGVRLSLLRPEVFTTQLRAILRAAAHGPVRVLIPMVTDARELRLVRKLFKPARRALESAGYELGERVELGAMIEIPAAAIAIESILAETDFVSIGTNDLTQYLLAADRNNDAVSNLYEADHAALSFLIERVAAAGAAAGKPVAVCGEMAGDPPMVERLLRLGVRELSMHPGQILEVRRAIGNISLG